MKKQEQNREREIAERARQLFAESVQGIDGETRSRLTRARAKAVEAAGSRRHGWLSTPSRFIPLGGVAAVALVAALVWPNPDAPVGPVEASVFNDLDILLADENLDLFEDLEFYAWLLEQPELLEGDDTVSASG